MDELKFDEIAKEVKSEIALKMKEKLPSLFENIDKDDSHSLALVMANAIQLSMTFSYQYTDALVKRVLAESNQESDIESK